MIPFDKRDGKIWYNNELVEWQDAKLHVISHGLHYASLVFEGLRVYDGEIFKLEEHTDRLYHSAKRMDITIPYEPRPLQETIHNELRRFNVLVCHRRFGKSVLSINQLIKTAVAKPMRKCAFIAPTYRQGKSIAWEYLKIYTKPLMYLGGTKNETELKIEYLTDLRFKYLELIILTPFEVWGFMEL